MPSGNGLRFGTERKPGLSQHREANKHLAGKRPVKVKVYSDIKNRAASTPQKLWEAQLEVVAAVACELCSGLAAAV